MISNVDVLRVVAMNRIFQQSNNTLTVTVNNWSSADFGLSKLAPVEGCEDPASMNVKGTLVSKNEHRWMNLFHISLYMYIWCIVYDYHFTHIYTWSKVYRIIIIP